jgi:hypothetical protein
MMNRTLSLLGFLHRLHWLHAGITPDHLLFHPKSHGLCAVGWCGATLLNGKARVPMVAEDWRGLYPPEVLNPGLRKMRAAHPATDLYMAAKSLCDQETLPDRFVKLYEWMTAASPTARPVDAWVVQERWIALVEDEYGPPQYSELALPKN